MGSYRRLWLEKPVCEALMKEKFADTLLVEHATESISHRVHPETPFYDIVDLMVSESVEAVPVVGDAGEVLGVIGSGDVLERVLRDTHIEPLGLPGEELSVGDVMIRSVLCVSEGQPLIEVALMMVHKKMKVLPVVRDGVLIGILSRGKVLRTLYHGPPKAHQIKEETAP